MFFGFRTHNRSSLHWTFCFQHAAGECLSSKSLQNHGDGLSLSADRWIYLSGLQYVEGHWFIDSPSLVFSFSISCGIPHAHSSPDGFPHWYQNKIALPFSSSLAAHLKWDTDSIWVPREKASRQISKPAPSVLDYRKDDLRVLGDTALQDKESQAAIPILPLLNERNLLSNSRRCSLLLPRETCYSANLIRPEEPGHGSAHPCWLQRRLFLP